MLNAHNLGDLVNSFSEMGYIFISQEETLTDSAYQTPVTTFSKRGNSWIFRWGETLGTDESVQNGDPEVPEFVSELAESK